MYPPASEVGVTPTNKHHGSCIPCGGAVRARVRRERGQARAKGSWMWLDGLISRVAEALVRKGVRDLFGFYSLVVSPSGEKRGQEPFRLLLAGRFSFRGRPPGWSARVRPRRRGVLTTQLSLPYGRPRAVQARMATRSWASTHTFSNAA